MSHSRVIICLHVLQGFYDGNNQLCINLNINFLCACKDVYGSILLYFCLCRECLEDLTKKKSDTDHVNNKGMKYCVAAILAIMMFYEIFLSPQVKRIAIISNKHGIYELPHELPNDLRLRKLGNIKKI